MLKKKFSVIFNPIYRDYKSRDCYVLDMFGEILPLVIRISKEERRSNYGDVDIMNDGETISGRNICILKMDNGEYFLVLLIFHYTVLYLNFKLPNHKIVFLSRVVVILPGIMFRK